MEVIYLWSHPYYTSWYFQKFPGGEGTWMIPFFLESFTGEVRKLAWFWRHWGCIITFINKTHERDTLRSRCLASRYYTGLFLIWYAISKTAMWNSTSWLWVVQDLCNSVVKILIYLKNSRWHCRCCSLLLLLLMMMMIISSSSQHMLLNFLIGLKNTKPFNGRQQLVHRSVKL